MPLSLQIQLMANILLFHTNFLTFYLWQNRIQEFKCLNIIEASKFFQKLNQNPEHLDYQSYNLKHLDFLHLSNLYRMNQK